MTSTKLCFLEFPNRIVVCESYTTPDSQDPETRDSKEYAVVNKHARKLQAYQRKQQATKSNK